MPLEHYGYRFGREVKGDERFEGTALIKMNDPPEGQEFDPYRDCVYETRAFSRLEYALYWANKTDLNHEGRADRMEFDGHSWFWIEQYDHDGNLIDRRELE